MPLIIDDDILNKTAPKGPEFTPKLFHTDITGGTRLDGSMAASGALNADVHPANPDRSYEPVPKISAPTKDQIDAETTVLTLLTQPLIEQGFETILDTAYKVDQERRRAGQTPDEVAQNPYLWRMPVPALQRHRTARVNSKDVELDDERLFDLGAALGNPVPGYRLYLNLEPQLVVLRKRSVLDAHSKRNINTRTVHIRYRAEFYAFAEGDHAAPLLDRHGDPVLDADGNPRTAPSIESVAAITGVETTDPLLFEGVDSFVAVHYAFDVPELLEEVVAPLVSYLKGGRGGAAPALDHEAFAAWSRDQYRLYDRLCDAAEVFGTEQITDVIIDTAQDFYAVQAREAAGRGDLPSPKSMKPIADMLAFLDCFSTVPLSAYTRIYDAISALDSGGSVSKYLIATNVQLKQNAELAALVAVKDQLPCPGPVDPARYTPPEFYTASQKAAIMTSEPLAMVIAGAGTGKTATSTEHLKMLIHGCGVDPGTIQAWSFTNAAADEIRDRNPGVISKTIARHIHDVYTLNFPDQQLSTMGTIANTVKIKYGSRVVTDPQLTEFVAILEDMAGSSGESNTKVMALNRFISDNLSMVTTVLEQIGMVTLELEIILAYLLIDNPSFVEPAESPDYLIVDEVQDNSAFQFVYIMRYATKHRCALYLVGDASQTLYEFRAANPKALSALEASGMFEVHSLSTNFRSQQEILDFANLHLKDIEANRFTQIQLEANDLTESTADSFTDTVKLFSENARTGNAFRENLKVYLSRERVLQYIQDNLDRGEVTAVLAQYRKHVQIAEEVLTKHFPGRDVYNLTSDKGFDSTTFSGYVANYWHEVTAVEPKAAPYVFHKSLMAHLAQLERGRITPAKEKAIEGQLIDWWSNNSALIDGWLRLVDAGVMTAEEFFGKLAQSILDHEVSNNTIRQSLLNQKNAQRKAEMAARDPKLMVSTIHGVKGMEFDNVIVILEPETDHSMKDEPYKRLLYVALTRARKSEMVLAGVKDVKQRIEIAYKSIVEALEKRDEAAALAADDLDEIVEVDGTVQAEVPAGEKATDGEPAPIVPVVSVPAPRPAGDQHESELVPDPDQAPLDVSALLSALPQLNGNRPAAPASAEPTS